MRQLKPSATDEKLFLLKKVDTMDYIGIHFFKHSGRLFWRHMEKPHWQSTLELPEAVLFLRDAVAWASSSRVKGSSLY